LSKIEIPVGLFVGRHDYIADVEDNEKVRELLPNVAKYRIFENEDHLSFSFQRDMSFFKEIIQFMDEYL
jgi:pimeloyl-ACP methyl ester carboxylesterase